MHICKYIYIREGSDLFLLLSPYFPHPLQLPPVMEPVDTENIYICNIGHSSKLIINLLYCIYRIISKMQTCGAKKCTPPLSLTHTLSLSVTHKHSLHIHNVQSASQMYPYKCIIYGLHHSTRPLTRAGAKAALEPRW